MGGKGKIIIALPSTCFLLGGKEQVVSTVIKAQSLTLYFCFDFTHSDLLETDLPHFATTAHQGEPLNEARVYRSIISHIRDTTSCLLLCLVLLHLLIALKVKALCVRKSISGLNTLPF